MSKEMFDEAEQELKAGIELNQKSFKLRVLLSEIYVQLGKLDEAIGTLKECLSLEQDLAEPEMIQTKNVLARVYLMRRDLEEAERYVDEVLKESPKSVEGHFIKGNIYLLRGEGVKATSEFRIVVKANPQFIPGFLVC